jgi:hypothetical protein
LVRTGDRILGEVMSVISALVALALFWRVADHTR